MKTTRGWLKQRGRIYYACWTAKGQTHTVSTGTANKGDAADKLAELVAPYLAGNDAATFEALAGRANGRRAEADRLTDAANPPLTVSAAWGCYKTSTRRPDIAAVTLKTYESIWDAFATWIGDNHPEIEYLRDMTATHAEEYGAHLVKRGVSGRTVNAHRQTLRAIWNVLAEPAKLATKYVLRDGRVSINPWSTLAKRNELVQGRRALTVAELRKICATATGELRLLLALGVYTACRLGDAAMMDWGSIDMALRQITFTPRKTAAKVGKPISLPMHAALLAILATTPEAQRQGPVCPELHRLYEKHGADPVAERVTRHIKNCGMATSAPREGVGVRKRTVLGFHSIRHTAISLLREGGAAQSTSMGIAGHSDASVHALYSHADEAAVKRAIDTLPDVANEPRALTAGAAAKPGLPEVLSVKRDALQSILDALKAKDVKTARARVQAIMKGVAA
jgi:integrase